MNILFVNEYAGYFGGVEQNVAHTVKALTHRGHRCSLSYRATTDKEAGDYRALFDKTLPCVEQGAVDGLPFSQIVSRVKPDVIYVHRVDAITPFLHQACPVTRMIHDHDLCCPRRHKYYVWNQRVCHHRADWRCWLDLAFLERDPESRVGFRFKNLLAHQGEMKQHRHLDRLIVASRFMHQELLMNGFRSHQVTVLAPLVPTPEREPTPPSIDPHVLYVGQLIKGKGVDLLLRALARVRQPFRATIVGGGNSRPKLDALVQELKLADRVRMAGWVPHSELHRLYQGCRLVAVPSRWPEPYGMIGLEAMGFGRPLVGFAAGGIPDWLLDGVNGRLIPELAVGKFANAVDQLLGDYELSRRLGRQGFDLTRSRFSFDGYIDKLEEVLTPS